MLGRKSTAIAHAYVFWPSMLVMVSELFAKMGCSGRPRKQQPTLRPPRPLAAVRADIGAEQLTGPPVCCSHNVLSASSHVASSTAWFSLNGFKHLEVCWGNGERS